MSKLKAMNRVNSTPSVLAMALQVLFILLPHGVMGELPVPPNPHLGTKHIVGHGSHKTSGPAILLDDQDRLHVA